MDLEADVVERVPSRTLLSCGGEERPVFVDSTGRRARTLRHAGLVADLVLLGYLGTVVLGLAGGTPLAPGRPPGKESVPAAAAAPLGERLPGGPATRAGGGPVPVIGTTLSAQGRVRPQLP
ncbi:hypothetical protein ABT112_02555 [Streptomyces sp. NPDC002055]|uniref:hypothetical protein n=1 Tax=Streptomyces sp. NPDC002055 TaxID=3154534 RepID=UPI003328AC1E